MSAHRVSERVRVCCWRAEIPVEADDVFSQLVRCNRPALGRLRPAREPVHGKCDKNCSEKTWLQLMLRLAEVKDAEKTGLSHMCNREG